VLEEIEFDMTALRSELQILRHDAEIYRQSRALLASYMKTQIFPMIASPPTDMRAIAAIAASSPISVADHMYIRETVEIVKNKIHKPVPLVDGMVYARMHPIYERFIALGRDVDPPTHLIKLAHLVMSLENLAINSHSQLISVQSDISLRDKIRECLNS